MFQIDLPWKSFNVNTGAVEEWVKAQDTPHYVGCSADHDLTLWFSEEPGAEAREMIQEYWDKLDSGAPEAKFVPRAEYLEKLKALKAGIPGRQWDDLSPVEQGIILGKDPSYSDLGLTP